MAPEPPLALLMAEILNAGYMVRHYARGRYNSGQRLQRAQAIQRLGLACREAFNHVEEFEPILRAICDALLPREEQRF